MGISVRVFQKLEWYDVFTIVEQYRTNKYIEVLNGMKDEEDILQEETKIRLDLLPQLYYGGHIDGDEYRLYTEIVLSYRFMLSFK